MNASEHGQGLTSHTGRWCTLDPHRAGSYHARPLQADRPPSGLRLSMPSGQLLATIGIRGECTSQRNPRLGHIEPAPVRRI